MTEHKHIFGFKLEVFFLVAISLIGIFLMMSAGTITFQFIIGLICLLYAACWLLFSDTNGSIFFWRWKLKNIKKMWD